MATGKEGRWTRRPGFRLTTPLPGGAAARQPLPGPARPARLLDAWLPADDPRLRSPRRRRSGCWWSNLVVGPRPLYGLGSGPPVYEPALLRLGEDGRGCSTTTGSGRALDGLFDADRASLLTELMLGVIARVRCRHCRSCTTTPPRSRCTAVPRRGRHAAAGQAHPGDHLRALQGPPARPEAAGVDPHGRPPTGRCRWPTGSPTATPPTTRPTSRPGTRWSGCWAGADFLYVADSKLCSGEAMRHIDSSGGRFVTVLPRTRGEDKWFRDWIQTNQPQLDRSRPRCPASGSATPTGSGPPSRRRCPRPRATASSGSTPPARPPATQPPARPASRPAPPRSTPWTPGSPAPRPGSRPAPPSSRPPPRRLADTGAARWVQLHRHRDDRGELPAGEPRPARRRHPLPAHHQTRLHPHLRHPRRHDRLRRRQRRLLPADHQRPATDRRRSARRLPVPAQPRTPPPPAQERPGRRPGLAARPRPHRSDLLLPVPRPARRRAHRTPDPHRHEGRRHRRHPALPRTPRLRRPIRRTDPRDLRRPDPPRTPRPTAPSCRPSNPNSPRCSSRSSTCSASPPPPTRRSLSPAPAPLITKIIDARSAERQSRGQAAGDGAPLGTGGCRVGGDRRVRRRRAAARSTLPG